MVVDVGSIDWYKYITGFGLVPEQKRKRKRGQGRHRLLNCFTAFDIETSTIWLNPDHRLYDVHSFMYTWQFQIEDYTVTGRTWYDFFRWLDILKDAIKRIQHDNGLEVMPLLIIWVHNLAYEFSFLSGLYPFRSDECFFRDVRKPIYCRMFDCFEYRCSYIQTNLSLSALCHQTGVLEKLSGQKYDYDKIRFPWTPLSDFEQDYCIRDVESLVAAMKKRVSMSGDNLSTVPITSTGYVRRDCKNALADQFLDIREIKPAEKEYRLLRKAFRGGNTHANRYYVGKIVNDVYSYDISSSYPTQQLTHPFPVAPFRWLELDKDDPGRRLQRVFTFIGLGYAVVGTYQFKNIRLTNKRDPIPYISLSRCDALDFSLDNGRILEAGYIEISLTEIDLEIIFEQYTFDSVDIIEAMVSKKDMLPAAYRAVIQDYYNRKTALKGDNTEEGKYIYMKSKNSLNSVYGMSATDPIHQEITYKDGEYYISGYDDFKPDEILKLLKTAAFPYQWGVYTTAYARLQLQNAIRLCGDKLIYCDTDSVKTAGPVPIETLNNELMKAAVHQKAYADDKNGHRHYIGLFEDDGHYDRFITQGAKRYAYESAGKMGVTVAGVSKKVNEKTGVPFAVEELGCLENFKTDRFDDKGRLIEEGMEWHLAGGTLSVYNDNDDFDYTDPVTGNTLHISKNVAIVPSTYKMTYSRDYRLLLNEIQLYGDYKRSRE